MGQEVGKEKCEMGFHLKGEEKTEEKKTKRNSLVAN